MDPLEPWIEPSYGQALDEYLSLKSTHLNQRQTRHTKNFSFTHEGNNAVKIVPRNTIPHLLVIEELVPPIAPGIQTGTASDGVHSISFGCNLTSGASPYSVGDVVFVHSHLFRALFGGPTPKPTTELLIHSLHQSLGSNSRARGAQLRKTPSVRPLLRRFHEVIEPESMGDSSTVATPEMEVDDSPIEQCQFQTQVDYDPRPHKRKDTHISSTDLLSLIPPSKSQIEGDVPLSRLRTPPESIGARVRDSNSAIPGTSPNDVIGSLQHLADEEVRDQNLAAQLRPAERSIPTVSPIEAAAPRPRPSREDQDSKIQSHNSDVVLDDQLPQTPEPRGTHMHRWRHESMKGGFVPLRARRIPIDQANLLGSEDSYRPALAGRGTKPGSIPITLLEQITEKANAEHLQISLASKDNPLDVPASPISDKEAPDHEQGINDAEMDAQSSSSQELGPSQWPPTPDRTLPQQSLADSSPMPVASIESPQPSPEPALPPDSSPVQAFQPVARAANSKSEELQKGSDLSSPLEIQAPSGSNASSDKIQVKRTPYHGKQSASDLIVSDMPSRIAQAMDVDEPNSTFIPCTYEDTTRELSPRIGRQAVPVPAQIIEVSESDGRLLAPQVDQSTRFPKAAIAEPPQDSGSHTEQIFVPSKEIGGFVRPAKHRTIDTTDRPAKRQKMTGSSSTSSRGNSAYLHIDQQRRVHRRAALSDIGQPKDAPPRHTSPLGSSNMSNPNDDSLLAPENDGLQRGNSAQGAANCIETPVTTPSAYAEPDKADATNHASSITGLQTTSSVSFNPTFTSFCNAYSEYAGNEVQFRAACSSLKNTLAAGGMHPHLFDDFVYHYLHSYPPHVDWALNTGSNALQYCEFFNTKVEPTHFKRILDLKAFGQSSLGRSAAAVSEPTYQNSISERDTAELPPARTSVAQVGSASNQPQAGDVVEAMQTDVVGSNHTEIERMEPVTTEATMPADEAGDNLHKPSQNSSIETWIDEMTQAVVPAREPSPELGTPALLLPSKEREASNGDGEEERSPSPLKIQPRTRVATPGPKKQTRKSLPWDVTSLGQPATRAPSLPSSAIARSKPKTKFGLALPTPSKPKLTSRPCTVSPFVSSPQATMTKSKPVGVSKSMDKAGLGSKVNEDSMTPFQRWAAAMISTEVKQLPASQVVVLHRSGDSENGEDKRAAKNQLFYRRIDFSSWKT